MTDDERAIRQVIADWLRFSEKSDLPRILKLMTDDVVFLVCGRAPFGKDEFASGFHDGLGKYTLEATSDVREVQITGELAFCSTDLTVVMTPLNGDPPVRRRGNTLSVFRKSPTGTWQLARDANLLSVEK